MIKWSEFCEGDVLYEAFLPEHEAEACQWTLRASCRGHVLAERRHPLTWPPKFGPDAGDVAVVEAMSERLITELADVGVPDGTGAYAPTTQELPPADPFFAAALYALVEASLDAQAKLGVTDEQVAKYLNLPLPGGVAGLFPFAVTPERDARLHRLVALARLVESRPAALEHKDRLVGALLVADQVLLIAILKEAGVEVSRSRTDLASE